MLQDYVAKESSLLELKTEKLELAQGAEGAASSLPPTSEAAKRANQSFGKQDSLEEQMPLDG